MNPEQPSKGFEYTYRLMREGNNEELVEGILQSRGCWRPEAPGQPEESQEMPNLIWKCGDEPEQIDYSHLKPGSESFVKQACCVHKLPNTVELDDKSSSFRHLSAHCQKLGLDVFDFVPLTFSFRLDETEFTKDLQTFAKVFKAVERGISGDELKPLSISFNELLQEELEIYYNFKLVALPTPTIKGRKFKNPEWGDFKLNDVFCGANTNMWILKPSRSVRGRGIEIFRSLEELEQFLQMYVSGCSFALYSDINYSDDAEGSPNLAHGVTNSNVEKKVVNDFVIQKYMEKPALLKGYKFDIRPHGLLTQDRQLYLLKELYGRVASHPFSTEKMNYFAHLTNNCVARTSKYHDSPFENHALTHKELICYLATLDKSDSKDFDVGAKIFDDIAKQITLFHQSFYKDGVDILNPQDIPNIFELFGYDIMLDESLRCWFIEGNESPGIDHDGIDYDFHLFSRMIDDLFRLTIDVICPIPKDSQRTKEFYSFLSYPDDENLWLHIADLSNK